VDRRVNWEPDEVHTTADEALQAPQRGPQSTKLPAAVEWLRGRLEEGCQESLQLEKDAVANGITKKTLWRARKELKVRSVRSTTDSRWYVSLQDAPGASLSRVENNLGLLGLLGHLGHQDTEDCQVGQVSQVELDEHQPGEIGQLFPRPRKESA